MTKLLKYLCIVLCFIYNISSQAQNCDPLIQMDNAITYTEGNGFISNNLLVEASIPRYLIRFKQKNVTTFANGDFTNNPPSSARFKLLIDGNEVLFTNAVGNEVPVASIYTTFDNTNWEDVFLVYDKPIGITEIDVEIIVEALDDEFEPDYIHIGLLNDIEYKLEMKELIFYEEGDCEFPPILTERDNSSFAPYPNKSYVISAWVKENTSTPVTTYTSSINISFLDDVATFAFAPTGAIIDGWQRIEGTFTIPNNATAINIALNNSAPSGTTYYDDIRLHQTDGNMKSFVYDPETQRLMAELDENNYATLYEYDNEGGLVRVKKETEKGIYTIQETRSSNTKN